MNKSIKKWYKDNHVYTAMRLSFRLLLKEIGNNFYSRTEFISNIVEQ